MALLRAPDGSETLEVTDPAEIAHYQSLGATLVQPEAPPAGSAESRIAPAPNPQADLIAQLNAPHEDFMGMGMPPLGRLVGAAQGGTNLMQEAGSLVARGAGAVARGAGKLANAPILRRLPGTGMVRGMAKDAAEMAGKGAGKAASTLEAAAPGGAPAPAAQRASEAGRELAAHRWTKPAAKVSRETSEKVAGEIKPGSSRLERQLRESIDAVRAKKAGTVGTAESRISKPKLDVVEPQPGTAVSRTKPVRPARAKADEPKVGSAESRVAAAKKAGGDPAPIRENQYYSKPDGTYINIEDIPTHRLPTAINDVLSSTGKVGKKVLSELERELEHRLSAIGKAGKYASKSKGDIDVAGMNQKHVEQAFRKLAKDNPKPGSSEAQQLETMLRESLHRLQTTGLTIGQ